MTRETFDRSWRRTAVRAFTKGAISFAITFALTLGVGLVYEVTAAARAGAALDPPGRLVSVGDGAMHLDCEGAGSPTVLLEAGNMAYSGAWRWLQGSLSASTRVCSYDRRGLGWSEDIGTPRDGRTIAAELHQLLTEAGETGPLVLVGHSVGALYVRSFAQAYPDRTTALVLIDPSHPRQFDLWPEQLGNPKSGIRMMKLMPWLARTGILRATNLLGRVAKDLSDNEYRVARHFLASPGHLRVSAEEMAAFDTTAAQLGQGALPQDLPVHIISATSVDGPPELATFIAGLHEELTTLTSNTSRVHLTGADHYTIVTRREHAEAVAERIRMLVVRKRSSAFAKTSRT